MRRFPATFMSDFALSGLVGAGCQARSSLALDQVGRVRDVLGGVGALAVGRHGRRRRVLLRLFFPPCGRVRADLEEGEEIGGAARRVRHRAGVVVTPRLELHATGRFWRTRSNPLGGAERDPGPRPLSLRDGTGGRAPWAPLGSRCLLEPLLR